MKWQPIRLAISVISLLAGTAIALSAEQAPPELQPPGNQKLLLEAQASGVQIYVSKAEAGGAPKWVLEAPLADLKASHGGLVIHHYAGPSWAADDGSKVAKDEDGKVISVKAPSPASDIPWLLIKVTADHAAGVLDKVDYVQRISTKGGVAPSAPPARPDVKIGVPYSATYVFYGPGG
jgi:hypothetical protein